MTRVGMAVVADSTPEPGSPSVGAVATDPLPVVGIGASAGGLEALRLLFAQLPPRPGMAFVVIQHLDPDRPSLLTNVLETVTDLRVVEATNGMRLERSRVHVIPPGSDITVEDGMFRLVPRHKGRGLHLPIDGFFRSLAEDRHDRAIGVVLSGSGADGTEGLRAIKAAGGIAIAQDPDSAQFESMPRNAIAAGVVDFRGTPEKIADEIARLGRHPYVSVRPEGSEEEPEPDSERYACVEAILTLLRDQANIDFSGYKRTTVLRRIAKRMALRRVNELREYVAMLREDLVEVQALAHDMLIHVTSFFRDPEAFEALADQVFGELAQTKQAGDTIRIWVPGCSTGEEVYAIAICLLESLGALADTLSIKMFGTDLSDESIEAARLGVYPESAMTGISPERVSRFFESAERGYRIGKRVRDLCVFVTHDLTRDPPFAKLDLISCRNVLIYFDADLQRRVIPMLHYCLNESGYLFVGKNETIVGFRDLFAPVDKEGGIYVKTGESPRLVHLLPAGREAEGKLLDLAPVGRRHPAHEAQRQADHWLLARYAPPGVVVNDELEIIQFRGRTGAYLEPPPGQPQANLLRMAREELVIHLHDAVQRAKEQGTTVRKDVRLPSGGATRKVSIEVVPLAAVPSAGQHHYLILFEETETSPPERPSLLPAPEPPTEVVDEVDRLETELRATKDYLRSLISEHESITEELGATNEELLAANEELQSTNEELQSAKEELQSTNEELSTVNDQLLNRNTELDRVANDLVNVLASVEIPVIIVDPELRVRRFTSSVADIASFIPEDVGRSIDDLKLKIDVSDLASRIQGVIDSVTPKHWEVREKGGRWFRMQITPYRTADDRLDGAVLSFVDIDVLKKARTEAEHARDYARSIVETVMTALVVVGPKLDVISANSSFQEAFALSAEAIEGRSFFELGRAWEVDRHRLEEALAHQRPFSGIALAAKIPELGRKVFSVSGRPIVWGGGAPMMLVALEDVTSLRRLEEERAQLLASEKQARVDAERANRAKDVFLAVLSHELRTPLSTILMSAEFLRQVAADDDRIARSSASIERAARAQATLIDDLLDVSRIVSGKLLLDLAPVDFEVVVRDAVDAVRPSANAKSLALDLVVDGTIGSIRGDATRLHQVVSNLLTNAIKFTPKGGRVSVRLEQRGDRAELTLTDTGMGVRREVLPKLFDMFAQADSSVTRSHGGLGLGLSIVRHLVEVHGGWVQAESEGEGKGATFRVVLPVESSDAVTESTTPQIVVRGIAGVRVLLVEDDDDTRESYASMLSHLGADVRAVPSAAAGIEALAGFRPQVILSDIAMPTEDGISFIQRVRQRPAEVGGDAPAAALTALAGDQDRRRALDAGFQMHVAKPVDAARLAGIVATLAEQQRVGSGA